MPLKIIQFKVNRRRNAHNLLQKTADEKEAGILAIQEPNINMIKDNPVWIKDLDNDTAILCRNKKYGIVKHTRGHGYITLNFGKWSLINCYFSPNKSLQDFKIYFDTVIEQARMSPNFVIAGDLNAKSTLWNSRYTAPRGDYIAEWMSTLNKQYRKYANLLQRQTSLIYRCHSILARDGR
ncbi:uncharacterized protein [Leptinotarsa decemlineata]|uniref:uncharacterized protein n=1 Tax=Leptinotarsa decemlineata TaxID=7539 RepID=UPI000C251E92|nr:uncharacterized protein LOC111506068 [Leptinotarsa decemlineata]